jgi:hypothetical protein
MVGGQKAGQANVSENFNALLFTAEVNVKQGLYCLHYQG